MIDIHLLDLEFFVQGIQLLPIIVAVAFVLYRLYRGEKITAKARLVIWSLFGVSVLAASVVYGMTVFDYVHNDRPIYQAENRHDGQH